MCDDAVASVNERLRLAEATGESEFECMGRKFVVHENVFPPTHFQSTGIFTRNLPYVPGRSFLEVGCGAGVTAITAALEGCRPVVACDISEHAVRNSRANAERHGVDDVVSVRRGDLFEVLHNGERFDVIFWNSNFVFVPADHVFTREIERAFFDAGYASHERFLGEAPRYLNRDGRLLLGFSSLGDRAALERLIAEHGYAATPLSSTVGSGSSAFRYDILHLRPAE